MKAYADFRVPEKYAKEFLPPTLGQKIMGFVRRVRIPIESGWYEKIGHYYEVVKARDHDFFFLGWNIERKYTTEEVGAAELLLLRISRTFEPAGLECGTRYDVQDACPVCGSGVRQISELLLQPSSIPRNVDIAKTISSEIVLSQELADVFTMSQSAGVRLGPMLAGNCGNDSTRPMAKVWNQLFAEASVDIHPLTRTGINPFDDDLANEYRCRYGHTVGLNILSELFIARNTWDGGDIAATRQLLGVNRGLLRTYPLLVISQRFYRLMVQRRLRGFTVEVVTLME